MKRLRIELMLTGLALGGLAAQPALATWSIVLVDYETKEVAVGSVTCLTSFDLLALTPVVLTGTGAGCVQAAGDFDGIRRPIIHDQLLLGTPPSAILALLAQVTGHQQRQYGIVDSLGRSITFSGSQNSQWAGGVIGQIGSLVYAVQGNVLAGGCVVPAMINALTNSQGDVPSKLMEAMQAARLTGGDGRCSCSTAFPTICGCPPPFFTKSGHIGYLVDARIGDADDPVCNASGCADGMYFMKFNVAFQSSSSPDPVVQLQSQFDIWRGDLVGRPDAVISTAVFGTEFMPANGIATTSLAITLLDWSAFPIEVPIVSVIVEHAPGSSGNSTIGPVVDLGGGAYSVTITAGTMLAAERLRITVDDGIRPVVLMPDPLFHVGLGDVDGDGHANLADAAAVPNCLNGPNSGPPSTSCLPLDLDADGDVDVIDARQFQIAFGAF